MEQYIQHLGTVTITGLNLKSIKQFVKLHKPLVASLDYLEYPRQTGDFYGRYQLRGPNVDGYWFPDENSALIPGRVTLKTHQEQLTAKGFKVLLSTNGLAHFRTSLKGMYNADMIEQAGELSPLDRKQPEHFTITWS